MNLLVSAISARRRSWLQVATPSAIRKPTTVAPIFRTKDNTQVPHDSFNQYMPIKKVAMLATDDRKQRA
jgi:hypothetical protein